MSRNARTKRSRVSRHASAPMSEIIVRDALLMLRCGMKPNCSTETFLSTVFCKISANFFETSLYSVLIKEMGRNDLMSNASLFGLRIKIIFFYFQEFCERILFPGCV